MFSLWTWICLDQANLHLSKELQWFREFMVVSSSQARFRKGAKSASLRDEKVLPEVRNRPLLPGDFFGSSILKKLIRIQ